MSWQPIETAPKDGTPFLAAVEGRQNIGAMVVARRKAGWGGWQSIPGDYAIRATHWMPLPDPPFPPKDFIVPPGFIPPEDRHDMLDP